MLQTIESVLERDTMDIVNDNLKRRNILSKYYEEHPDIYQQIKNSVAISTLAGTTVGGALGALSANPYIGAGIGGVIGFSKGIIDILAQGDEIIEETNSGEKYKIFK